MWYKEWRHARYKILAALVLYTLISVQAISSWLSSDFQGVLIDRWWSPASLLMLLLAGLGGIDLISEEKDSGTLGFLLSRPISRTQVYRTKHSLNLIWLMVIFTVFTLLMLALSFLPVTNQYPTYGQYAGWVSGREANYLYLFWAMACNLAQLIFVLMLAVSLLCYTAFVSLFARSVIETLVMSLLILLATGAGGAVLNAMFWHIQVPWWFFQPPALMVGAGLLGVLSLAFYLGGLRVFKRKEF